MFLAPLIGLPVPLLPIQILWINLVTDGLPGLALAVEPEEADIMRRPPRPPHESVFARGLGVHVLWVGPLMAALVLGTQAWSLATDSAHWHTMVFTTLCFAQLATIYVPALNGVFKTAPLSLAELAWTLGAASVVLGGGGGEMAGRGAERRQPAVRPKPRVIALLMRMILPQKRLPS
jgi:Ca2+-transporting ATPase